MICRFPALRLIPAGSGAEETRTPDFRLAKAALYQLSYGPKSGCAAFGDAAPAKREQLASAERWCRLGPRRRSRLKPSVPIRQLSERIGLGSQIRDSRSLARREWALLDSNQRPLPYQGSALTS
jgi:hypothetical protein